MNIAQLSEQLKDVPQNRLIDYARNPNSVVPQFLALAEIQRRQQLSAQVAPPATTVAEEVLAQAQPAPQMMQPQMAQQLPENQPGVAQLPTGMPQGMAGGGIVAFADGGLSDEEEDREMDQLFPTQRLAGIGEALASLPVKAREFISNLPKSYEETKRQAQTAEVSSKGLHKYEADVIKEAKRQGIDPNLALHVLYKETGNLDNPEAARSRAGALGVMQLMPKTAKELGVNPLDPQENIRGGISYLKKMYDKYGDARTAAAAYNAGPGNVDKALKRAGGLDTLHRETRNYIAGLAQGGEVKHYEEGGYTGLYEPAPYDSSVSALDVLGKAIGSPVERLRNAVMGLGPRTSQEISQSIASKPEATKEAPKAEPAIPRQTVSVPPVVEYTGETEKSPAAVEPTVAPKSKADLYAEALEKDIEAQAAKAAKAGDMNLALSILQTGLGMLGSKSPYFAQGIGEAGQQGVSTYAALQKQEADRQKEIMAARLGLYKYGAAQEGAAETREYNRLIKEQQIGQRQTEATERAEDRALLRYQQRLKDIESAVRKPYANNPLYSMNPEKFEAEIQAKIAQVKASDNFLRMLGKRANIGDEISIPTPGSFIVQTPKGPVSFPSQEAADEFKRKAGIK